MFDFLTVKCNDKVNPIGVGSRPHFSWMLINACVQESYRIIVRTGDEIVWDSGTVNSDKTCGILYAGKKLEARTEYTYTVTVKADGEILTSALQTFETALLDGFIAKWIHYPTNYPGYALFARNIKSLTEKPVRARMYIAGIGYYEVRVNGKKVGNNVLNPGVTDYSRRVLYDTYDVTEYYRKGSNITGVTLGSGWYGAQKFMCEIYFTFADGSVDYVETRAQMDWFMTGSPIIRQSIYGGESYDARREELVDGWDGNFHDIDYFETGWMFSLYAEEPGGKLVPQENEPIRVTEKISPVNVARISENVRVYDMGVIFAGWAKIKVKGERGAKVTLKYAEAIKKDGSVDMLNLRSATSTDEYILKGGCIEEWAPRFTYHGFRYIQVETEGEAELIAIEGEAVRSGVAQTGSFECSDPVINKLHESAVRTEASNMHSIPTDCPQRDERLGWLNDLTSRLDQVLYNFGVNSFYEKFMHDITDTQGECGEIGDTAPYKTGKRPADPVIASYLLIPLRLYERYGNERVCVEQYDNCKKWVDYLLSITKNDLLSYGIYGDWAPPREYAIPGTPCNAITEPHVVSGAYMFWYCKMLSRLAEIVGKPEDADKYSVRAEQIKKAYNEEYFDYEKGVYKNTTQSGNSIPLNLGLCPEGYDERVAKFIASDVAAHDYHLTCGNQGYKHMLECLGDRGYVADAIKMITNPTYPGWGYMIKSGATTIWERWEAEMASEMNSFCHPMHGSIDFWFYAYIAGIRFDEGCFGSDKLVIQPEIACLDYAKASLETPRGTVKTEWRKEKNTLKIYLEIPSCTRARLVLPGKLTSGEGFDANCENPVLLQGKYNIICQI